MPTLERNIVAARRSATSSGFLLRSQPALMSTAPGWRPMPTRMRQPLAMTSNGSSCPPVRVSTTAGPSRAKSLWKSPHRSRTMGSTLVVRSGASKRIQIGPRHQTGNVVARLPAVNDRSHSGHALRPSNPNAWSTMAGTAGSRNVPTSSRRRRRASDTGWCGLATRAHSCSTWSSGRRSANPRRRARQPAANSAVSAVNGRLGSPAGTTTAAASGGSRSRWSRIEPTVSLDRFKNGMCSRTQRRKTGVRFFDPMSDAKK